MSKNAVLISTLSAAAVMGALAYWVVAGNDLMGPTPTPDSLVNNTNPQAIANQWQWDNFTIDKPVTEVVIESEGEEVVEPELTDEVPYDVILIYNMLQDIQLDENGLVVPDQMAKYALERGFDDLGPNVSPDALSELQDLIRIGLPGEAGEEAARIMRVYYEFRLAEEEFNRQVQARSTVDNGEPEAAAASSEHYENLVQLRRRHLGNEIADGLFAVEEVQARHLFSTIAIQQNTELDDEEKQAQLQALQERLNERLLALGELTPEEAAAEEVRRLRQSGASNVEVYLAREAILGPSKAQELADADREETQWQNHFDGFWKARQNIMQASLDEAEREHQIEQLMGQYFSPDEQERARFTSSQWQSRERR